ncbi:hypothetical protein F441_05027 [Phytophthora nicotianae CJ01A1]|uniref:Uncharacterized protein n=4 Tax=Phytophthora nicotianae TaxID=4792 RepID=W2QGV8_PHYN3|nr:hypothetical protein PPTG_22486 [Phytophthora nicotianae INRA-310]ETK91588.1 hypothetical protein L915_04891 [Phytophthora nicotianae]ETP21445.1 hypothetical protein F441_05027 [Phytophthora nicotianae CJ01A1]ETP49398.1 hypothetical protein F442_05089 [Phytophthora nicotianae P10297]ETL44994.1 hypothetical protein L916_04838 [Phytophthora nicotianae]ETN12397.1 hypothetical protein PPTG_22486 [Phytophthora nicotianae INRA-310]
MYYQGAMCLQLQWKRPTTRCFLHDLRLLFISRTSVLWNVCQSGTTYSKTLAISGARDPNSDRLSPSCLATLFVNGISCRSKCHRASFAFDIQHCFLHAPPLPL